MKVNEKRSVLFYSFFPVIRGDQKGWEETEAASHKISLSFIVKQAPVVLQAFFKGQIKVVLRCFLSSF